MEAVTNLKQKFSYEKSTKESVPCNFCGSEDLRILSIGDSEGLGAITVMCKVCGLVFISPRMTKDFYDLYYQNEYRTVTLGVDNPDEADFSKLFEGTVSHGVALGKLIKEYLCGGGPIVEVGSGPGGVLSGMQKVLGKDVVGIEPSKGECEYANKMSVKTFCNLFEDFNVSSVEMSQFGAVVCTQSLNHLLDPKSFFIWSHNKLSEKGVLVLETMNFRHQLKKAGAFRNAVQIDHVYMFTPEVLKNFVESAGFDILLFDYDEKRNNLRSLNLKDYKELPGTHIRIVARKSSRNPFENVRIIRKNYFLNLIFINRYYSYVYYLWNYRFPKLVKSFFYKKDK